MIVVAGNAVNLVLELLFVYGFHWGIAGSAAGTAIAQAGMGSAFAWHPVARGGRVARVAPRPDAAAAAHRRPHLRADDRPAAAFLLASAVVARTGTAWLGAHQVAFQLWIFLALILDSIAIAGQVIVGRTLGAGEAEDSFAAASRMVVLWSSPARFSARSSCATGSLLPHLHERARVLARVARSGRSCVMQPLNGAVFALDGILIGAGDSSYIMWSMVGSAAVFAPIAIASLVLHWGLVGIWVGDSRADLRALRADGPAVSAPPLARGRRVDARGRRGGRDARPRRLLGDP